MAVVHGVCSNSLPIHVSLAQSLNNFSIQFTVQKATIHQVTTMLAVSKNVLFPGHNHLLTTGIDDPSL